MSTNRFSVQDLMLDNHLYSRSSELSPPTAKATVGYNWTSIFRRSSVAHSYTFFAR